MARGQVFTLPSATANLIETSAREEAQSVAVLNPNDGVVYLKLNGPAGPTSSQWDWKLPSQSYGLFPGPWISLGLYYLDQSGSGRSAELNVYDSSDKLYTPYIVAIGRAVQSAGTTVDISQGAQPANPPASTARLWVDGTGHLHVLQSNGTDFTTLDSNNFATYVQPLINSSITSQVPGMISSQVPGIVNATALGGDLYGTVANGHVGLQNNSYIYSHNASGTTVPFLGLLSDNNVWFINGGGGLIRFINATQTLELARIDNAGNMSVANTIAVNGGYVAQPGDISAHRSDGTGVVYLGDGAHYIFWDGATYSLPAGPIGVGAGASNIAGSLHVGSGFASDNGVVYFNSPASVYIQWDGTWLRTSHQLFVNGSIQLNGQVYPSNQGTVYIVFDPNQTSGTSIPAGAIATNAGLSAGGRVYAMAAWGGTDTSHANAVLAPNIGDNRGSMLAWAHQTWSSVDHAKQYGLEINDIQDPMILVNSISGYYYAHASMKGEEPILRDSGEIESNMTYGFAASEVNTNIPEMAGDGWVDTSRMLAILWEAVKEIDARLTVIGG